MELGLGTGFTSKRSEIERCKEQETALEEYVLKIPDEIGDYIDEPLYKGFNSAMDHLATIDMRDVSTDNTLGLKGLIVDFGAGGVSISCATEKKMLKY